MLIQLTVVNQDSPLAVFSRNAFMSEKAARVQVRVHWVSGVHILVHSKMASGVHILADSKLASGVHILAVSKMQGGR